MTKRFLFGGAFIESIPANVGLAILRVFVGLSMALGHGLGKLPPSERFVTITGDLGFPVPEFFAWVAAFSEFGGGLLLALGLLTRPGAFFIWFTMLVAGFFQHAADPFSTKEMAFLYLVITGMFVVIGSGKYGVDTTDTRAGLKSMISDLSLMKIQVGTLFVHDDEERLRFINEPYRPEDHPAPVFFLGRTRCGIENELP